MLERVEPVVVNEVREGPLRREPARGSVQFVVEIFGVHRSTETTSVGFLSCFGLRPVAIQEGVAAPHRGRPPAERTPATPTRETSNATGRMDDGARRATGDCRSMEPENRLSARPIFTGFVPRNLRSSPSGYRFSGDDRSGPS
jgi:hypothetical protein